MQHSRTSVAKVAAVAIPGTQTWSTHLLCPSHVSGEDPGRGSHHRCDVAWESCSRAIFEGGLAERA